MREIPQFSVSRSNICPIAKVTSAFAGVRHARRIALRGPLNIHDCEAGSILDDIELDNAALQAQIVYYLI